MRVEIQFAGDSHDAVDAAEFVSRAVANLKAEAERAGVALDSVRITTGQATESDLNARRIAQGIQQIGQDARTSRLELERLKLTAASTRNPGAGVGPFGSGFGRVGLLGTAVGLGAVTSGPLAGGVAALGAGAAAFGGAAAAGVGTLVAAFHGLGDAIDGDKASFDKLNPESQQFVQTIRSLIPWLHQLQDLTRAGLFPGLEAGLHDALSPENARAIEQSATLISKAVGGIATEFGQLMGSPTGTTFLTDLGTHGAEQLSHLGDAAVHLASAILTLDHAGQPLADWLAKVIDEGGTLADQWTKTADASGKLASGASSAQHELQLVAQLVGALAEAAINLARDLEPLGNEVIVELTHGLQDLAGWLDKNHDKVVEITTGALSAFNAALKIAAPLAEGLAKALDDVVEAVGGWKTAFELILGGALAVKIAGLASTVALVGTDATVAAGEVTGLRAALLGLGAPEVLAALAAAYGAYKLIQNATQPTTTAPSSYGPKLTKGESIASVQNDLTYLKSVGQTSSQTYFALVQLEKEMKQTGSVVATAAQISGAEKAAAVQVAANTAITGGSGQHGSLLTNTNSGGIQLPTSIHATHQTSGLPGFPAVDIMAAPGTPIRAPEDGMITRIDGHEPTAPPPDGAGGPWGLSIYYVGASGTTYYMTHLMKVAVAGSYRKGDVIGLVGNYPGSTPDHVHFAVHPGSSSAATGPSITFKPSDYLAAPGSPSSPATKSPFGKPPPFKPTTTAGSSAADLLPAKFRLAIAKASTTAPVADDRSALNAAIKWLKANIGGFTGEDEINAYMELASLLGQLKALAPKIKKKAKPAVASAASLTSAAGLASTLTGDLGVSPFAGILPTTPAETQTALTKALAQLASVKAVYGPKVKAAAAEINKAMTDGTMSAASLSTLRARMNQWQQTITAATSNAKTAAQNAASTFQQIWQTMATDALAEFDKTTAAFVSPAQLLINQLQDAHDSDALNRALDQANTDLATALKGHAQDAQTQLDSIRQYVGQQFLANAIDAAQSAVLGGPSVQTSGASILRTLQGLLTGGGSVINPDEVKQAQQEVEDAKYQITIAGLTKQATAQQNAWDAQRAGLRIVLENMANDWASYATSVGFNINAIKQAWMSALAQIDPAAAAALSSGYDQSGAPTNAVSNAIALGAAQAVATSSPTKANIIAAVQAATTAGYTQSAGFLSRAGIIPGFAAGADFVTRGPTPFMAGEGGRPERVTVTPITNGSYGTPTGATPQFNVVLEGDLTALGDFVKVKAVEAAPALNRRLGAMAADAGRAGRR